VKGASNNWGRETEKNSSIPRSLLGKKEEADSSETLPQKEKGTQKRSTREEKESLQKGAGIRVDVALVKGTGKALRWNLEERRKGVNGWVLREKKEHPFQSSLRK